MLKKKGEKKGGGGQNLKKKKKRSNIGSCPQAPVEYLHDPHKF